MNSLIIFLGGGFGALTRHLLNLLLPKTAYLPASTLLANFLGCFIATFVFIFLVTKSELDSTYKLFLITGFCGGLSTLSALSLELFEFVQSEEYVRAFSYAITTVLVCTLSVIFGIILVKMIIKA